jgi:hypothetical protein
MKAITIHQPWASLIAVGAKRFETRGWKTSYRGPIAIHAGKQKNFDTCMRLARDYANLWREITPLQFGSIIAIADLVECWRVSDWLFDHDTQIAYLHSQDQDYLISPMEHMFGDYTPGRYAWQLDNVRLIDPVSIKGQQGLWNWEGRP